MMKPTMISVGILEIMCGSGTTICFRIWCSTGRTMTIPIHIQYLKGSYGTVDLGATMALILLSIIRSLCSIAVPEAHHQGRGRGRSQRIRQKNGRGVTRLTIKDSQAQRVLAGNRIAYCSTISRTSPSRRGKNHSGARRGTALTKRERADYSKQQRTKSVLIVVKGHPTRCSRRWWKSSSRSLRTPTTPVIADFIDEDDNEVRRAAQLVPGESRAAFCFSAATTKTSGAISAGSTCRSVVVTNDAHELGFLNLRASRPTTSGARACAMSICLPGTGIYRSRRRPRDFHPAPSAMRVVSKRSGKTA